MPPAKARSSAAAKPCPAADSRTPRRLLQHEYGRTPHQFLHFLSKIITLMRLISQKEKLEQACRIWIIWYSAVNKVS